MKRLFIIGALSIGLYQEINSGFATGGSFHHHTNWALIAQQRAIRLAQAQAAWRKNFDKKIQPVIDKINEMTQSAKYCDISQLQTDAINQINACKKAAYTISADKPIIVLIVQKIRQIFIDFTHNATHQCSSF